MIAIREIAEADAAAFLALKTQLDHESDFLMLEPDERTTTVAQERAGIAAVLAAPNSTILVAVDGDQLVGYVEATGGIFRRNAHTACLVAAITRTHTGQGLGTRLFAALLDWARSAGLHRLTLTVMTHNTAGVALYRKMGFTVEGIHRRALRVRDRWVDEYGMACLLD
jgi:RimJ/RimL family protein N-acetyltransferase